jgi:outer membrane protein OmpA-like peptidoglycan-associated protein
MSSPPTKKPTCLANLILLGIILVVIGGALGGGWWAFKKFVFEKHKVSPPPAQKSLPATSTQSTAKVTPADTGRPSKGVLENPSDEKPQTPPATASTTAPKTQGDEKAAQTTTTTGPSAISDKPISDGKPVPSIPATTGGASPATATTTGDPNLVATTPNTAIPVTPAATDNPADALPVETVEVPPQKEEPVVVFNNDSPEVKALKDDADRRIEEAPPDLYPDSQKARVRSSLRNAKRLARVATLHFAPGGAKLGAGEQGRLKKVLLSPEASDLMSDSDAAFVCIGFADQTGDPQKNKQLSKQRSMGVIDVLKKMGVTNITYPVAIGGTELVAPGNKDKNRAVEVWLVVP